MTSRDTPTENMVISDRFAHCCISLVCTVLAQRNIRRDGINSANVVVDILGTSRKRGVPTSGAFSSSCSPDAEYAVRNWWARSYFYPQRWPTASGVELDRLSTLGLLRADTGREIKLSVPCGLQHKYQQRADSTANARGVRQPVLHALYMPLQGLVL